MAGFLFPDWIKEIRLSAATHNPESGLPTWLIVFALAMGGFGIGTGEFAIMGLMPNVAQDLGVSDPQVGHLISTYALGVVVGAPILAILGAQLFRRQLLILLMSFYALGNLASALASNYESLLVFRFIAGLPHGAYFGVAALVAASLVPVTKRAKAVSQIMMGDRKSTRLNSSHVRISYAVFCLKKKKAQPHVRHNKRQVHRH